MCYNPLSPTGKIANHKSQIAHLQCFMPAGMIINRKSQIAHLQCFKPTGMIINLKSHISNRTSAMLCPSQGIFLKKNLQIIKFRFIFDRPFNQRRFFKGDFVE